jgi:hypothetical protein
MKDSRLHAIMLIVLLSAIGFIILGGCCTGKAPAKNPQSNNGQTAGTKYYVCPMHPEIKATDPTVKCSICGMKLVPQEEASNNQQIYACPMHPEEHSTDPNAVCSKCGMALQPVKETSEQSEQGKGDG